MMLACAWGLAWVLAVARGVGCGDGVCSIEENCVDCADDCGFRGHCLVDLAPSRCAVPAHTDRRAAVPLGPRRIGLYEQFGFVNNDSLALRSAASAAMCQSPLSFVGTIPYGKSAPGSPRSAFGQQGALLADVTTAPRHVWLGVREPFCGLRFKGSEEIDLDEFGIAYFLAQALDQVMDVGMVPPTCLRSGLNVSMRPSTDANLFLRTFALTGAVNALAAAAEAAATQKPESEVAFVVQATLPQQTKARKEKGVLQRVQAPDNPVRAVLACRGNGGGTECDALRRQCAAEAAAADSHREDTRGSACHDALYTAAFAFVGGLPLMSGPTSVFFFDAPPEPGTGLQPAPLFVGDCDRIGHCKTRTRLLYGANLTERVLRPVEQTHWLLEFFVKVPFFPRRLWLRLTRLGAANQLEAQQFGQAVLDTMVADIPCMMDRCSQIDPHLHSSIVVCVAHAAHRLVSTIEKHNITLF